MQKVEDIARVFEYLSLKLTKSFMDRIKISFMLYLAQGYSLAKLRRGLFSSQIEAWNEGPIIPEIHHNFYLVVDRTTQKDLEGIHLSNKEINIISEVWEKHYSYTTEELANLIKEEDTPWSIAYKQGGNKALIPQELLKQYFSKFKKFFIWSMFDFRDNSEVKKILKDEMRTSFILKLLIFLFILFCW